MLDKVVFLDRDGVINHDSDAYIKSVSEFHFLPRSLDAIRLLTENGFHIILITNQSAIGRGMISRQGLSDIHGHLVKSVEKSGGHITDIFFCPHTPEAGCNCRKPNPGLIYNARDLYDIRLSETVMIGDSEKDMVCARRAGCRHTVLVKTGNGERAAVSLAKKRIPFDFLAEDLYDAALWLLAAPSFPEDVPPQGRP